MTLMSTATSVDDRDDLTCRLAEASECTGVSAPTLRYIDAVSVLDMKIEAYRIREQQR